MTTKAKIEEIVEWLKKYQIESNTDGFIVGLSGGIDSAVVAHLIRLANPENSLGVIMPCNSHANDAEDAFKVVNTSGIESSMIDLSETFNVLESQLKNIIGEDALVLGNMKARLRMTTLYSIAQSKNYLVVGTDNAAEWYTGYFTKYGDGGVDIVPLINLTKGEVREIAKFLNVDDDIINKNPSAGLWENQTDEEEMGISYDTIDKFLTGEEITSADKEILNNLHKKSEHKRNLPPGPLKK